MAVCVSGVLGACADTAYFWQSARGHVGLLAHSRSIDDVLGDREAPQRLKDRLALVQQIRAYSISELHLPDNWSYRRYVDTGSPFVVWNVMATPATALTPKTWCFPVTGCVSYKGFYDEQQARALAQELVSQGLDVAVSGVPAYSTLGYTPDPVLNTFLFYPEGELARLLFHELAHQVVYIKDDTAFNEGFAVAVEELGVDLWLKEQSPQVQERYLSFDTKRRDFRRLLADTQRELRALYARTDVSEEEKLTLKKQIFSELRVQYESIKHERWGGFSGYDRFFTADLNNAKIAGFALYDQYVPGFKSLFEQCDHSFECWYSKVKSLGAADKPARQQALFQIMGSPSTKHINR